MNIIIEMIINKYRKHCPVCKEGLLNVYNFYVNRSFYCPHCDAHYYQEKRKLKTLPEKIKLDRQFRIVLYKFCGYTEGFWDTGTDFTPRWIQKLLYKQNKTIERIEFYQYTIRDSKGIVKNWIYSFPKIYHNIDFIGKEFVTQLQSYQFKTDLFSNLYIKFTPLIPEGDIKTNRMDDHNLEVEYGLLPNTVNELNYRELELKIKEMTLLVLKELFKHNDEQIKIIFNLEEKNKVIETQVERVIYINQEDNVEKLTLSYEPTFGDELNVFLKYTNNAENISFELIYYHLFSLTDLNLIDKIFIEDGIIIIEPKNKDIISKEKDGMSYYFFYRRFSIESYIRSKKHYQ
ncbi:MAG: hypothetical protein K0Q49_1745 [Haloplasmataceae bacterium]|nr:hypothetical protein [Haloplasmataceae bacterium]